MQPVEKDADRGSFKIVRSATKYHNSWGKTDKELMFHHFMAPALIRLMLTLVKYFLDKSLNFADEKFIFSPSFLT